MRGGFTEIVFLVTCRIEGNKERIDLENHAVKISFIQACFTNTNSEVKRHVIIFRIYYFSIFKFMMDPVNSRSLLSFSKVMRLFFHSLEGGVTNIALWMKVNYEL